MNSRKVAFLRMIFWRMSRENPASTFSRSSASRATMRRSFSLPMQNTRVRFVTIAVAVDGAPARQEISPTRMSEPYL